MSLKMFLDAAIAMGGAANFKVGTTQDSRAERAKKIVPTFPNVGYKQANINRGQWLKWFCEAGVGGLA